MKIAAQTLLVIFAVLFFTAILITSTFKFQVLDYSFWTGAFQRHDVYRNLAQVVKTSVDNQIGKEGGSKNDITVLTDLVTPENTADFVDNNLLNLLNFMTGKAADLQVYVPITKVPKGLLPKNIAGLNNEMTLTQLSQRFNITGLENLPLTSLSGVGATARYLWLGSMAFVLLVLVLLFLVTGKGARFVAFGITLILSGSVSLVLVEMGKNLQAFMAQNFLPDQSIGRVLIGTVIPPVLGDIIQIWTVIGVVLVLAGVLLFFIKKPRYNDSK